MRESAIRRLEKKLMENGCESLKNSVQIIAMRINVRLGMDCRIGADVPRKRVGVSVIFFMPVFSYNHPYHCSADILDEKWFL